MYQNVPLPIQKLIEMGAINQELLFHKLINRPIRRLKTEALIKLQSVKCYYFQRPGNRKFKLFILR